jgi:hypothetical protein
MAANDTWNRLKELTKGKQERGQAHLPDHELFAVVLKKTRLKDFKPGAN